MTRYRIGFENPATKCGLTERNPGYIPIVDTDCPFVFGQVIAICDNEVVAKRICAFLNQEELRS